MIDCVVAPVDQVFPVADEDVKVTELPEQNVVGPLAVMVGVAGSGLTVTVVAAETEEHDPLETVTVYEPLAVTVMDCVVAPVDQVFPVEAEDVRVTEPPAQKEVGPLAVIVGIAGVGLTVTVVEADVAEQPFASVNVTVYEPLEVTVIDWVAAPFDQVFPVAADDVNTTDPPEQKVVGPLAVIVGATGSGFTVTVVEAGAEVQPLAETVKV